MNHEAIYALYPNAARIDDATGVFDASGNAIVIDEAAVNAWVNPREYIYRRVREYPPVTDYIDGVVKGDQAQIAAYIAACQAVKNKYPKPE